MKKLISLSALLLGVILLAGCAKAPVVTNSNPPVAALNQNVNQPAANDWKTYTDSEAGFTFKYPNSATLDAQKGTTGLTLDVTVKNINTIEAITLGYDKATALKDKAALVKGDPSTPVGSGEQATYKMLSINGALAKEFTVLRQLEVCNVQFQRQAVIYKDNYQAVLSWGYAGNDLRENNPSYFEVNSSCGSVKAWVNSSTGGVSAFYADLVAGKTDTVSQAWFTDFDKIIKTFEFTK